MRATAGWFLWAGGWIYAEVEGADLVIQMCQGHSGDAAEVVRKAIAELQTYGDGQTEITVGVAPGSLAGLIEGDEAHVDGAWREMAAFTATLDDETNQWTDVPQFETVLDTPEQRIDRVHGAIGGLTKGTSHLTRPIAALQQPNVKP